MIKAWAIRVGRYGFHVPYYLDNKIFDTRKSAQEYKDSFPWAFRRQYKIVRIYEKA